MQLNVTKIDSQRMPIFPTAAQIWAELKTAALVSVKVANWREKFGYGILVCLPRSD